ncbi:hypothetical protein POSPLADRAFT_1060297 [Postia placenta MAD-698-R-SB12]|uniref:Cytochrome P450 n=1 Tax=Postia placenta MAD-698-R-SB12 TaxID=670580 RepID=A0A1X6MPY8_9APHY|nr:hypothetical protein POSPLADRAFT_1060297 [Postia placenta MAD-698-R-SB12]OSX58487.1 hypothetical protein POSPLADRAFT_1060297 [Postia placenta MAD-698-R-SB12]
MDNKWRNAFGGVARIWHALGRDALWVSDPQAINYILGKGGYAFEKTPERRATALLLGDEGIDGADGATHRRQRRVMEPAFTVPVVKAFSPTFVQYAESLCLQWTDLIDGSPGGSSVVNIADDLNCAMVDTVCDAAFDYHTGCLQNADNQLGKSYMNLMSAFGSRPSSARIVFDYFTEYLTPRFVAALYRNLPVKGFAKLRHNRAVAYTIAGELLEQRLTGNLPGTAQLGLMDVFARATVSPDANSRMSRSEMTSQMRIIMFAGSETMTNTLTFALLELARHPEYQHRLRAEIRAAGKDGRARGAGGIALTDVEAMPFLQAFIKEVIRFHPVAPYLYRRPMENDVLPLSTPITSRSGKVIREVPFLRVFVLYSPFQDSTG